MTRRRDDRLDVAWADGYPADGDVRACAAYASRLPDDPDAADPFGYYEVVEDGLVVGGIGFHGPPSSDGTVEVGYGVVPSVRGRGVATTALRLLLDQAATMAGVTRVHGRTEEHNVASRRVMAAAGMQLVRRDDEFLHYMVDLEARLRSPS